MKNNIKVFKDYNLKEHPPQKSIQKGTKKLLTLGDGHCRLDKLMSELILSGNFLLGQNFGESKRNYKDLCAHLIGYQYYSRKEKLSAEDIKNVHFLFSGIQKCLDHLQLTDKTSANFIRFLGDLLGDRGPNDAFVIFLLLKLASLENVDFTILISNHDQGYFVVHVMRLFELLGVDYDNPDFLNIGKKQIKEAANTLREEIKHANSKKHIPQFRSFMRLLTAIEAGCFPIEYLYQFYKEVYVPRVVPFKLDFFKDHIQLSTHTLIGEETLIRIFNETGIKHEEKPINKEILTTLSAEQLKQYEARAHKNYRERFKWGQNTTENLHYAEHISHLTKTPAKAMKLTEKSKQQIIEFVKAALGARISKKKKFTFKNATENMQTYELKNLLPEMAVCQPRPEFDSGLETFHTYVCRETDIPLASSIADLYTHTVIQTLANLPVCNTFGHSSVNIPEEHRNRLACLDTKIGKGNTTGNLLLLLDTAKSLTLEHQPITIAPLEKFRILQVIQTYHSNLVQEKKDLTTKNGKLISKYRLFAESYKEDKENFLSDLHARLTKKNNLNDFQGCVTTTVNKEEHKNAFAGLNPLKKPRTEQCVDKIKKMIKKACPEETQIRKKNLN